MDGSGHMPVWTGRSVQRTIGRGRRIFCEPFKAWIVEQAMRPGISISGLALRNEINANQLRRWVLERRRRSETDAAPRLLPVTIAAAVDVGQTPVPAMREVQPVEIEVCGAIVRVREGCDATTLRLVLTALRSLSS